MKADFYGRKSNKDNGRSVAGQEQDFRADCDDQGYEVGRIFADPDRSASRYARRPRPDYGELVAHIRSGHCELLSLWESSRGSRNLGEWVTLLDLCRKHNVLIRIISHGRTYDMTVRRDWRTLADEGVDSADESEKISERTRRGKRLAAKQGRPTSRLAYGFRRVYDDRGHFVEQVPHPEQAPVVREVIERIAAGEPFSHICRSLNARGIPAAEGGQWSDRTVRQLATRHSYVGKRVHLGQVVSDGQWPALVDVSVWNAAQLRLAGSDSKHNDPRLAHWLTGVIRCGRCNATLRSTTREAGRKAYECRSCFKVSASARALETIIEAQLLARLSRPDAAAIYAPGDNEEALQQAIADRDALQAHLNQYYDQASRPGAGLSPAGLAAIERNLLPQIEQAEARVRQLTTPPALAALADVDVPGQWSTLPVRVRREVAAAVADIVLDPAARAIGPRFDRDRLAKSRWRGDTKTWGEHWATVS